MSHTSPTVFTEVPLTSVMMSSLSIKPLFAGEHHVDTEDRQRAGYVVRLERVRQQRHVVAGRQAAVGKRR